MSILTTQEVRSNNGRVFQQTIGVTAVRVSVANIKRVSFEVVNLHSQNIYYGYTQAECTVANGFPIFPNGYKGWIRTALDIWLIAEEDSDVRMAEEFHKM